MTPGGTGPAVLEAIKKMIKAYKYRIYPSDEQATMLNACFAAVRKAWNHIHSKQLEAREKDSFLQEKQLNHLLTEWLNDPENEWARIVPRNAHEAMTKKYFEAWKKLFRDVKKGINTGAPRFKSFRDTQSISIGRRSSADGYGDEVFLRGAKLNLASAIFTIRKQDIKIRMHRHLPDGSIVRRVEISRTKSKEYYISISFEIADDAFRQEFDPDGETLSIDAGVNVRHYLDGTFDEVDQVLDRNLNGLARLQRSHQRKVKGSKNREKSRIRLARKHEKIARIRENENHNATRRLVDRTDVSGYKIEGLRIQEMAAKVAPIADEDGTYKKNGRTRQRRDNRKLANAALYDFRRMLEYKAREAGKTVTVVDPLEATNKTCHICGHVNNFVTFRMKTWKCEACGERHKKYENSVRVIDSK